MEKCKFGMEVPANIGPNGMMSYGTFGGSPGDSQLTPKVGLRFTEVFQINGGANNGTTSVELVPKLYTWSYSLIVIPT